MLQQVREMFGARKLTATEGYRKLVSDTADGKTIPETAVDTCIAAGRSVADFEGDVAKLSARRQAVADLKKAEAMTAQITRLGDAYTKAAEERRALEKRHREEMDAASAKVNEPFNERRSLFSQQGELQRRATLVLHSSADPAIGEQIAALKQRKESLQVEANTSIRFQGQNDPNAMKQRTEWLTGIQREQTEITQQIEQLEARLLDPEACAIG